MNEILEVVKIFLLIILLIVLLASTIIGLVQYIIIKIKQKSKRPKDLEHTAHSNLKTKELKEIDKENSRKKSPQNRKDSEHSTHKPKVPAQRGSSDKGGFMFRG